MNARGHHGLLLTSAAPDPSFSSVVLLLHGEGANAGTVFTDSSSYGRSVTSNSGTTTITSNQKYGTACISIGGSNVGLLYADSADFHVGTADWLVEAFVNFNSLGSRNFIFGQADSGGGLANTSIAVEKTAANKFRLAAASGGSAAVDITGTTTLSASTWYYVAAGRQGTAFRLFSGTVGAVTLEASATSAASINNSTGQFGVGRLGDFTTLNMVGLIDEFRFTNGVYRDVATIGVPTAAFPNS